MYEEKFVGRKRLDIIVEEKILLELKAVPDLTNDSYNRIINYLKVFKIDVGLLINFGTQSLQFKRFANYKGSAKSS